MIFFFFFKQKTAYEMRISDWSSDVCSSDLRCALARLDRIDVVFHRRIAVPRSPVAEDLIEKRALTRIGVVRPPVGIEEIGRASCRERVCQYVESSVVAVSLKKKKTI